MTWHADRSCRGRLAYPDQERGLRTHEYLLRQNVHVVALTEFYVVLDGWGASEVVSQ